MPDETRDHRIKRLTMRSMRRGIKEMDLILSAFAAGNLERMSDSEMALYDVLLSENDHDLYAWVTGQQAPPGHLSDLVSQVSRALQSPGRDGSRDV